MNRIFIDGFLAANPEKRRTQKGIDVASARLVHRDKTDDPGMWLGIVAWGSMVDELMKFKKGDLVGLFGRLISRSWTDGANNRHERFEIKLDDTECWIWCMQPAAGKPKVDGAAYAKFIPQGTTGQPVHPYSFDAPQQPAVAPGYASPQPPRDDGYDIPGDRE